MDLQTASILIIGLQETTANSIKSQRKKIMRIGRTLGTIDLGREPGNKWFAGKYDYPYIRDVFMNYGGVVDVTETSVSWSKVLPLYTAVSEKMRGIMRIANIPGYLGCHISHSYHSGACLYFTFAVRGNSDYPLSQYLDLKQAIVEEILAQDGALSHHHAIGYEHQPWFGNYVGSVTLEALWGLKNKLDPNNICNPGKLLPTSEYRLQKYWPFWEHSSRLMAQPKEELAP
jgi:alkyldihydroxyacetonephosphate synthase